ncbi:carbohydrate ABC transporter permease [Cohnella fermenti]|uniref:carbohydrate ABC transporter permease n=1 Tax=Cohnella fermenti TaxID=2565925 RepID=UPI001E63629E|nr:carbohydrate ABC transporter permease [Cohnella fermenti]
MAHNSVRNSILDSVRIPTHNPVRNRTSHRAANIVIHLFFLLLTLFIVLPMLLIAAVSLTEEKLLARNGYRFWPESFSLDAYRYIFEAPAIVLRAYGVTTGVTIAGTLLGLLFISTIGYAISRRDYRYSRITTFYVFFTMLFSGGLVPFYILMTQYLHVQDTLLALILPGLLSPFYVMIMKGFLDKIPPEMAESAKIDGAGEWTIYSRIILPLSAPALATIGLFVSFILERLVQRAAVHRQRQADSAATAAGPNSQHDRLPGPEPAIRRSAGHRRSAIPFAIDTHGDGHRRHGADHVHLPSVPTVLRQGIDGRSHQRLRGFAQAGQIPSPDRTLNII